MARAPYVDLNALYAEMVANGTAPTAEQPKASQDAVAAQTRNAAEAIRVQREAQEKARIAAIPTQLHAIFDYEKRLEEAANSTPNGHVSREFDDEGRPIGFVAYGDPDSNAPPIRVDPKYVITVDQGQDGPEYRFDSAAFIGDKIPPKPTGDKATLLKQALNAGVDLRPYYGTTYSDAVQFKQDLGQYAGKDQSMIIPANPVGYGGQFQFDPNFGSTFYRDLATQAGSALGLDDQDVLRLGTAYFADKFASGPSTKGVIGFTDFGKDLITLLSRTAVGRNLAASGQLSYDDGDNGGGPVTPEYIKGYETDLRADSPYALAVDAKIKELGIDQTLKPLYDASNQVFSGLNGAARVESDSSGFFKQIAKDIAASPIALAGIAALTGGLGGAALGTTLGTSAAIGTGVAAGATAGGIKGIAEGSFKDIAKGVIGGGALGGLTAGAAQGLGNLYNGQEFTSGFFPGGELPTDYFVGGGLDGVAGDLGSNYGDVIGNGLDGIAGDLGGDFLGSTGRPVGLSQVLSTGSTVGEGQDFFGGLKPSLPDSSAIGGGELGMGIAPADPTTGIRDLGGVGLGTGAVAAGVGGAGGLDLLGGAVKKGVGTLLGGGSGNGNGTAAGLAALLGGLAAAQGGGGGPGAPREFTFNRIPVDMGPTPIRQLPEGGNYTAGFRTDPLQELNRDPLQFAREGMEDKLKGYFAGGQVKKKGIGALQGYAKGRMIKGAGDGMSDDIPAMVDGEEPVLVANEEYIIPAQAVSALGNGSSEAGAKVLDGMVERVYKQQTGKAKQMKPMKLDKVMPA